MATTAAAPAALELSVLEGDFGGEVLTPGTAPATTPLVTTSRDCTTAAQL